jgi:SagB-type dehydrogenase family enzyme
VALPNEIRARADALEVVSLGGATEASIWSIIYPIGTVGAGWKSIPYGRPMVNQTFHVFNDAWEPCPVWVAGHLFIGGIGLAQGYWRDEEKTRASFIEHPKTGERLYRTGDQGRYLPDGNIEFLGRNDFQVKVQGYRVELEEIEAVLGEHPAVRSSIVTAVGEAFGNKRLVAYVVAKHEPPARNELARFLSTRLPEYMLPAAYVMMDHLPLSANGKVDRRALPEPAALDLENSEDRTGDVTSQTARIARLVSDVLKIKHIDPEVNLFNLGATSIDVIRIVNLLDRELGYRPKIDAFYRAPTIAALTNSYEQHLLRKPAKAPELVDLTMQGTPQSVVASFKLLSDPAEREAFKKRQLGSRSGDHDTTSIQLPVKVPDPLLKKRFAERRSHRRFSLEPIRLEQLSRLLTGLRRIELEGKAKHLYASAGGLYAVQTYLYVKPGRIEGLRAGSYYYRPVDHRLLPLVPDVEIDRNAYDALINRPIYDQAGFAIYLIAQLKAIAPMYGERSVHFATIEAGLICQLLETAAPKHGIGLCQIGSLEFPRIRALFDLEESHVLVHSLLGGRILDDPTNRWSPFQEAAMAARTDREEGTL